MLMNTQYRGIPNLHIDKCLMVLELKKAEALPKHGNCTIEAVIPNGVQFR